VALAWQMLIGCHQLAIEAAKIITFHYHIYNYTMRQNFLTKDKLEKSIHKNYTRQMTRQKHISKKYNEYKVKK